MKQVKKLNEGIRVAKEGIEECWDDMEGQGMTPGQGEQMSVTISMPGKNISVTTDSAEEIGSILRLAGISVGAEPTPAVPAEMPGMQTAPSSEEEPVVFVGAQSMGNSGDGDNSGEFGDGDNSGHSGEEPEVEEGNEFSGALAKAKSEHKDKFEVDGKEYDVDEAAGDVSRTSKGGTVTQTATGQVHKAGPGNYGGSEEDHEDDTPVPAGAVPEKEEEEEVKESGYVNEASGIMISGKEVDRASLQVDGVDSRDYPDFSDAYISQASFVDGTDLSDDEMDELNDQHGELANELAFDSLHESTRILELAGVTNEAQSAAQKAAFKAMIDKKNGKSEDKVEDTNEADDEEKVEEATEEAPASNNVYGQGVYEGQQEYSRILELAGLNEWANSPQGKADEKGTVTSKLPSNVGQGGGNSQFGQNRANGQGENPMGMSNTANDSAIEVEEAFKNAMGEYRKFVSEAIANKK